MGCPKDAGVVVPQQASREKNEAACTVKGAKN